MKLIVHIGAEKCGSTSIQSFFQQNREQLIDFGVISPGGIGRQTGPLNHAYLVLAARGPMSEPDDLESNIVKANGMDFNTVRSSVNYSLKIARSTDADVCFISSEHISSRLRKREEISRLKCILNRYWSDVSIVAYVRDQFAWYRSAYSTAIRCGQTRQFSGWLERVIDGKSASWLNLYNDWASVFGENSVKFYGIQALKHNNTTIYQSIMSECGIARDHGIFSRKEVLDRNTSPDSKTLEIIRHINRYEPWMLSNGRINQRRSELIDKILSYKDIFSVRINDLSLEHARVIEKHIEENRALVRIFPDLKHDLTVEEPKKEVVRMCHIAKRKFVNKVLQALPNEQKPLNK